MAVENLAITRFREFLRRSCVHPYPEYSGSIEWLKEQAHEIGLEFQPIYFPPPAEFAIILKWRGVNPRNPAILLNSSLDAGPVDTSKWTREPFGAEKDEEGNIYGKGSQDSKSVGVQYLEAIRRLIAKGLRPHRDVCVSFLPDEVLRGHKGMAEFVKSSEFAKLNIGFALHTGVSSPNEKFVVHATERNIWQFRVTAIGQTAHAAIMLDGSAAEKLHYVITQLLVLRAKQLALLKSTPELDLGDVTSINITMLQGGLQANAVPPELSAVIDMRIATTWNMKGTEKMLREICSNAGLGVRIHFITQFKSQVAAIHNQQPVNPWWACFKSVADKLNLKLEHKVCATATDARYLREVGIPTIGFSPINKTEALLEGDEYLNENVFLRGIEIYEALIEELMTP